MAGLGASLAYVAFAGSGEVLPLLPLGRCAQLLMLLAGSCLSKGLKPLLEVCYPGLRMLNCLCAVRACAAVLAERAGLDCVHKGSNGAGVVRWLGCYSDYGLRSRHIIVLGNI